jgi:hypothetical protein
MHAFESEILPAVVAAAQARFQGHRDRDEKVQACRVVAFLGYRSLAARGKDVTLPCLIFYTLRHVNGGRHGIREQYKKDTLSHRAQKLGGFTVGALEESMTAQLALDPAPQAILNLDLPGFRAILTETQQKVAEMALQGFSGVEIAQAVGLTTGRVSQLRRQIVEKWDSYQGAANGAA